MTHGGIAIDCGWLMTLADADFDGKYAAMQLVDRMCRAQVPLLLDHEGKISAEYDRYFPHGSDQRQIITKLMASSAIEFRSGVPSAKCLDGLRADGFDPSDLPYIGVAEHGSGCYLTHEEKHLRIERCAVCLEHCGVEIKGHQNVAELAVAV